MTDRTMISFIREGIIPGIRQFLDALEPTSMADFPHRADTAELAWKTNGIVRSDDGLAVRSGSGDASSSFQKSIEVIGG